MQTLEKFLAVLVVIAFGGTVLPALMAGGALPASSVQVENSGVLALFIGVYVILVSLVLVRPSLVRPMATVSPVLAALVLLAFASVYWSIYPEVTFRRSVALFFTLSFGLYLGLRYRLEESVALLAIGIGTLIVASLAAIILFPDVGIDQDIHRGAWKGVFFQKNVAGRMIAWFALCVMWLDRVGYGRRWLLRAALLMAVVLLIMSRSGTGLLMAATVAVVPLSARLLRMDVRVLIPAAALLGLIALVGTVALTANFQDTMSMLGRDATLTGRTEIWSFGRESIANSPLLGYGYAAFWYGPLGPASYFTTHWNIASVHNGWMEVMLDLGLPGLLMMVFLMGRILIGGLLSARYGDPHEAAWILAVALGLLVLSISESVFLERHSINTVVFALATVRVSLLRQCAGPAGQAMTAQPLHGLS